MIDGGLTSGTPSNSEYGIAVSPSLFPAPQRTAGGGGGGHCIEKNSEGDAAINQRSSPFILRRLDPYDHKEISCSFILCFTLQGFRCRTWHGTVVMAHAGAQYLVLMEAPWLYLLWGAVADTLGVLDPEF